MISKVIVKYMFLESTTYIDHNSVIIERDYECDEGGNT